jgi:hypothetical protein
MHFSILLSPKIVVSGIQRIVIITEVLMKESLKLIKFKMQILKLFPNNKIKQINNILEAIMIKILKCKIEIKL